MIIARSPLRITLGGGGTDLPSYYEKFGGFLISAAIDKYIYINIHETFITEFLIKYSEIERVKSIDDIKHPIVREVMKQFYKGGPSIEIASMADIPAGTGLGSSGSFTTALIKAILTYHRQYLNPQELAEAAVDIEINKLKEPIGKQDQYIAAFGGITTFGFMPSGEVNVAPLKITQDTLYNLEDHLLLFFTGYSRSAGSVLKEQNDKSTQNNKEMIENLHFVKELGLESKKVLESGDLDAFALLMNRHWEFKKQRSKSMSNDRINNCYEYALKNGAIGGKLIGAGGGGFLMFYANDQIKLRCAMSSVGMQEVRFRFDFEGTKVVIS